MAASLEASSLTAERGGRELFRDIGFKLGSGELAHIAGSNGSGKTTLLKILCGLSHPKSGGVLWRGRSVCEQIETAGECLFVGHAPAIKEDLSALENLLAAAAIGGRRTTAEGALRAMERLGIAGYASRSCRQLSRGQRQRLALTRLAVEPAPPLWILDEPFSSLDADGLSLINSLLQQHLQAGGIAVITTHQQVPVLASASIRVDLDATTC